MLELRHGDVKINRKLTTFLLADFSGFKLKQLFTGRKDILCCQALSAFGCFYLKK
jgi:hypothetical protein